MAALKLIRHAPGAPGMRLLGLGPGLKPSRGLLKLEKLLNKHAFWAKGRNIKNIRAMLAGSTCVTTIWQGNNLVGFGRATSDGIYRAVLWDIVIDVDLQGLGLGSQLVESILSNPEIKNTERIYLMTTNKSDFYQQLGFRFEKEQTLMVR